MKTILVCGASFAGLCTAYWMKNRGYHVTVVELAEALKKGGTPVNIEKNTVDIVKRMGIFDAIRAHQILMQLMEFKNSDDVTEKSHARRAEREPAEGEYEIERDDLLDILFTSVEDDVEFIFGDTITTLQQENDRVDVTFRRSQPRAFDLVFGCDGMHSLVRKFCFGEEADFSHFLEAYFSITIVDRLLIPEFTTQLYNEPGRVVMLNTYNNKTDIVLGFFSAQEIPYDYRDEAQQRNIVFDQFAGAGWRTLELLQEVKKSKTFYFDKLCQMKMPSWTRGRIALVGDAGYCASPAAGKGGSLAIDGAAALADAFEKCDDDFELAFQEYNRSFRPFIEEVQAEVLDSGLEMFLPRTEEAIRRRNNPEEALDWATTR